MVFNLLDRLRDRRPAPPAAELSYEQAHEIIAALRFPPGVMQSIAAKYPRLGGEALIEIENASRDFLDLCVGTPSDKLVVPSHLIYDVLDHFDRHSAACREFCQRAFAQPLTLYPTGTPKDKRPMEARRWRTWELACNAAGIDAKQPDRAPPLFTLDERLGIAEPWNYRPPEWFKQDKRSADWALAGGDSSPAPAVDRDPWQPTNAHDHHGGHDWNVDTGGGDFGGGFDGGGGDIGGGH